MATQKIKWFSEDGTLLHPETGWSSISGEPYMNFPVSDPRGVNRIEYNSANKNVEFYFDDGLDLDLGYGLKLDASYGTEGQVITSHGKDRTPTWETPSGGGTPISESSSTFDLVPKDYTNLELPTKIGQKYLYFMKIAGILRDNVAYGAVNLSFTDQDVKFSPLYHADVFERNDYMEANITFCIERTSSVNLKVVGEGLEKTVEKTTGETAVFAFVAGESSQLSTISLHILKIG